MPNLFEFVSYRDYLSAWIAAQGNQSYGLKGKVAQALSISSSLFSQILKGEKSLTSDQTSDLVDHLGFNEIESDYFHLLVDFDRAGNARFKAKLEKKIKALQEQSRKIGKRVPRHKELTDEQRATYYSSWLYTGIRNMTAIPEVNHASHIAEHLKIEPQVVQKILRFLLENGLCREEGGKVTYGPASTHIDRESPFVNQHHQNWRLQAIHSMERRNEKDLFFTSPMSLSKAAANEIHKMIPHFIQNVMKVSGPSDSEIVACMNIDWFLY